MCRSRDNDIEFPKGIRVRVGFMGFVRFVIYFVMLSRLFKQQ